MALEQRMVLSAMLLPNGTLMVRGSNAADTIVIDERAEDGAVALTGVPGVADGQVFEGVRFVKVFGRLGNDKIVVSGSPKAENGSLLDFRLLGQGGNDILHGGPGDDDIRGGNGADQVEGRGGDDTVRGGNGSDVILGHMGNDRLIAHRGHDTLLGGPGDDVLVGNSGRDRIRGGSGDDTIRGGSGDDDLFGGPGADSMTGHSGRDLFRGRSSEFTDFNERDAFHSPVIGTSNEGLAYLNNGFWDEVEAQVGEGDLSSETVRALDSLQLLRARVAGERLAFDQAFAALTPQERAEAREAFGGIVDDFLADIEDNPGDLTSVRLLEFQVNVRDEFPGEVRDEFDDYVEEMIELPNQVSDLGDAMDDLQDDGLAGPYLMEFNRLFEF
ncbi:MAG: calcium-binding protein [Phycisphaerales bacterium]